MIKIKEATKQGYAIAKEGDSINLSQPNSKTRRGRVGGGMANTLDTQMQQYTIVKETMKDELKIYQPGHGYNPGGVLDGKIHPSLNANNNASHKQYLMQKHSLTSKCKRLKETLEKNPMKEGEVKSLDLYNKKAQDISPALSDPCHNSNRLSDGYRIRRLTPTECARLQGFPDNWHEKGTQWICYVGIKDAIEKVLQISGSALCTINDGNEMEIQKKPLEQDQSVSIVIDQLWQGNYAQDIIIRGKNTEIRYEWNKTLFVDERIRKNLIQDKMEYQSTWKLLNITLDEKLKKEKSFITSTLIKEIIPSLISFFAKIDENIIGVTLHWNTSEQNFTNEVSSVLRMENTISVSDSQAYRCYGNAVTVNIVELIARRLKA